VEIEAPGVDVRRLHDVLAADPDARARLGGGSVTTAGRLILVAARSDLGLARRLVSEIGGTWSSAVVRYGAEEFRRLVLNRMWFGRASRETPGRECEVSAIGYRRSMWGCFSRGGA
jgi:hypothetical protein